MNVFTLINLIIALGILNVWFFRFNKKTPFRGGESNTLKEEFLVYGLPTWFMYVVGFIKVSLAVLLIVGIWVKEINLYVISLMILLMLGALVMHIKVKDPIKKSVPALSILLLLLAIFINNA
ncbi:DoxX family protein [bacterium]|jgi:hypothetical protein|nr:DoxX family protein [bacterium]MDB2675233.1 DoxX family protein [Flavobacteriales bacterium]